MAKIRRARIGDAAAMARVHVDSWRAAYLALVPASVLNQLSVTSRTASWQRILGDSERSGSRAWVAELDGALVGFVSAGATRDPGLDPRRVGEIYAIYLAPAVWGRGLGSELMQIAEDDLAARGYREVTLWVLAGNTRARRFYELSGFEVDGGQQGETVGQVILPSVRYRRGL